MDDARISQLEQSLAGLSAENAQLRAQLDALHGKQAQAQETRTRAVRGGARLLIPLLDRNHVVRSFGKLTETIGGFTGPKDVWPSREAILEDARTFMESCVRFTVRRRTFFWVFSLFAAAIPMIQLWVVVQQNEIISNQNEFFEIQVHDVVSRSMTEGDRNARLMTGALLSRANLSFLADVVDEAFDPDLAGIYSAQGVDAASRRLQDAAFRGFLMRAVARGIELRSADDEDELAAVAQPMLKKILVDAADRVPQLLHFGEDGAKLDGELQEQVANYLFQLGAVIRVYGRLARTTDREEEFAADLRPFLKRVAGVPLANNRFRDVYTIALEGVAFDAATERTLTDPAVDFDSGDQDPEALAREGIDKLRATLGDDGIAWDAFAKQLSG